MKKIKNKEIFAKISVWDQVTKRLSRVNKPVLVFSVTLLLGIMIAFALGYVYSLYYGNLIAGEGIRDTLSYQGKIVNADGVPPPDGDYNMQFKIFNTQTDGDLLWTEVWDGSDQNDDLVEVQGSKVSVSQGVFTVELNSLCGNWVGDCSAPSSGGVTFQQDSFYLQVELDYNNDTVFEEIFSPRKRFTATPYSMNADRLDGRDSLDFILKSGGDNGIMTGSLSVPQVIDISLVTYLQFANYTSPGAYYVTNDSSPNNLSAKTFNTAPSEGILPLDGINAYGQIDDTDDLSFGIGTADIPFTISAWIQPADATNFIIAGKGIYNTNAEYKFYIDENDKISFQLFDESVDNSYIGRMFNAETLTGYEGTWVQLVATYNGNGSSDGIKIYFNGLPVDDAERENGSYVAMENLAADLHIGRYDTTYAKGRIDDFMIYRRALSADEVQSLYSGSQYKLNVNAYQLKSRYLVLTGIDGTNFEDSYMYYDGISNQIILDQKMFIPDNIPAIDNTKNDRDYTHFIDENKILAYDFSTPLEGINDLEGNADGSYNANYPFVNSGYYGYGFSLDHAGDYISFSDPGVSVTTGTIEMWAKLNNIATSETDYLAYFSESSTTSLELVKQGTSDLYAKVGDATLADTTYDIPDTNWHHYAMTWNNGNYEVSVDGASVATGTYTSPITAPTTLLLGYGNTADTSLNGTMDSVALYDDVLTETEIINHAQSSFNTLYINDKLKAGLTETTLENLISSPASLNEKNIYDPVFFQNTGNKKLALGFSEGYGIKTYSNDDNNNFATINGATWSKGGMYGHGMSFDGIDDYLEISDHESLDMGNNDFAIEFWINGSALGNNGKKVISKRDGDTGYEIYYNSSSDSLRFFIGDGTNTVDSAATGYDFSDGKWHHFMVSFDFGGNASIFRDGDYWQNSTVDISAVTGSISNSANLLIGKDSAGNYFNGKLDSVIFYDLTYSSQFNLYDAFSRVGRSPDLLFVIGRNTPSNIGTLSVINQSNDGHGVIIGMINPNNTSNYPLVFWNDNSYDSSGHTVYNMIYFGSHLLGTNTEYGNLKWDSTDNRFILSKGLSVSGDLTANYLSTDGNENLAHDVVRHTLTSGEAAAGTFLVSWGKAVTQDKIADLRATTLALSADPDEVWADDWTYGFDQGVMYDGTNFTVNVLNGTWVENDIVTIYIVYEK
ncbi:MAG: LamG domain-containing protein [Candidatus Parcubacteria bacterium]|nr:LamG domain-containing protein [Candidatus Parcubacteria bacterium]